MQFILNKRFSENKLLINDPIILEISRIYLEFEKEFKFFYMDTHNILQTDPVLKTEMENQIH
tara:strand:- start:6999 stop:7184 length:186 start_codon:yes stop_codon:yes gene_type:complete